MNHFRNLLIFQVSRGDLNLLEISEAETATLKEQSAMANPESLTRIMEVLTDAEIRLRDAASKKILLEVALLKAIEARKAVSIDAVLKRLQDLRGGDAGAMASAPAQPRPAAATAAEAPRPAAPMRFAAEPAPEPAPVAQPESPAAAGSPDVELLWSRLMEAVGRASQFKRSQLIPAHPVSFAKNLFTIGFDPEFADEMQIVDAAATHTLLQTKLAELGHAGVQFKFIKAEPPAGRAAVAPPPAEPAPVPAPAEPKAPAPAAPPKGQLAIAQSVKEKTAPVPFSKDDFKNDPLIQKALEIFKGTIVEVRA